MNTLATSINHWLVQVIRDAPNDISSIYVEYDYGGIGSVSYTFFHAFGFVSLASGKFDNLNEEHCNELGNFNWEPECSFDLNQEKYPDIEAFLLIRSAASSDEVAIVARERRIQLIIGEHDCSPELIIHCRR